MIHNQKVGSVIIGAAAILLVGCGPTFQESTLQDKRMKVQKMSLEGMKRSKDKADKQIDTFQNCMLGYGQNNAQSSATATEISEGALSACQYDLFLYKMRISDYYYYMSFGTATSLEGLERARDRGEEKARIDAQELAENGRRMVIDMLIKMRK